MVVFNMVEKDSQDKYLEYIRLYNKGVLLKEIEEKLDVSHNTLNTYYKYAYREGLIKPRITKGKFYTKVKNGYMVYHKNRDGKQINYGVYETEEEAQFIVEELKKVGWSKKSLKNIQLKAYQKYFTTQMK